MGINLCNKLTAMIILRQVNQNTRKRLVACRIELDKKRYKMHKAKFSTFLSMLNFIKCVVKFLSNLVSVLFTSPLSSSILYATNFLLAHVFVVS